MGRGLTVASTDDDHVLRWWPSESNHVQSTGKDVGTFESEREMGEHEIILSIDFMELLDFLAKSVTTKGSEALNALSTLPSRETRPHNASQRCSFRESSTRKRREGI